MTRGNVARRPVETASASAEVTSRNNGSPPAPGSFVRSMTAIEVTEAGIVSRRASTGSGRYRRT